MNREGVKDAKGYRGKGRNVISEPPNIIFSFPLRALRAFAVQISERMCG
jgi:hypothetical protein